VNSCIADALHFGDIDDPDSNVSTLLAENRHFRMHESLGTGPGFHYLWDKREHGGLRELERLIADAMEAA
jgi:phenylacetyl-CoA:acceptor oxidoreductase subunit 1